MKAQIGDDMLAFCRELQIPLSPAQFDTPLAELGFESLDLIALLPRFERKYGIHFVRVPLELHAMTPRQFGEMIERMQADARVHGDA